MMMKKSRFSKALFTLASLLAFSPIAKAADTTVSAMVAASALSGPELFYCVQGGNDRKCTASQLADFALNISVNPQSGASYSFLLSDKNKLVTRSNAGAMTDSLVSANYTAGYSVAIQNTGSGTDVITPTSGTIQGASDYSLAAGSGVIIVFDGSNYTVMTGAGSGGGLVVGSSAITGGTAGRLLYDNTTLGEALLRYSAGVLALGDVDAASPVAQTLTVQSVVAGTSNTAGADFTIEASKGTGTGASGKIQFKVGNPGGSGTSQNALNSTPILTLDPAGEITMNTTTAGAFNWRSTTQTTLGLYWNGSSGFNNALYIGNNSIQEAGEIASWKAGPTDHFVASGAGGSGLYFRLADDATTGVLAIKNDTSANALRVYNTWTDGSNNEYGTIDWLAASNVLTIGAVKNGSGTLRGVNIVGATLSMNGSLGVSCSTGTVTAATVVVVNGIVTHC